jgi:hypothetical protein
VLLNYLKSGLLVPDAHTPTNKNCGRVPTAAALKWAAPCRG